MSVLGVAGAVSLGLIGAGAVATVVRLVRGPGTPDRAVATDVLVTALMAAVLVTITVTGTTTGVPLLLVLTLLGFVSSSTLARFLPRGDRAAGASGDDGAGGVDGGTGSGLGRADAS